MRDYIVRVWVPLDVRIENVPTPEMAESIADDRITEQNVLGLITAAVDETDFWLVSKTKVRIDEAEPADD